MSKKGKLLFVLGILSMISLFGLFFAIKVWMPFMWFVLAPAVICFLSWFYLDYRLIAEFWAMKTTKKGLNMGALVFIVLVLLSAINFVSARHYLTVDYSINTVNTISDQSKRILSSLEGDLNVKFFYKSGVDKSEENRKSVRELVKHYQDVSEKVHFEVVEMNERPKVTTDFGASKGSGEAFIEYMGKKNRIENYSEQDFTNAIIKLTRKQKKNVYFLEGHNERSVDDEKSETSLFGFKQLLEKNSFNVAKFNLITGTQVPVDANVVVVAAPTQQLQPSEQKAIEDYLKKGGSLLLFVDTKDMHGADELLAKFSLELGKNYIFNVFDSPMGKVVNSQAATVAVEYSNSNEITKLFTNNQMTVFRAPLFINLKKPTELIQAEVIVKTPESSVQLAELDSKDYLGNPQRFNLGVAVKGKLSSDAKEFFAVVFSDVDFVSNILLYQNLNRDLALNSISALAKESDLIAISPKEPLASKMLVSPPEFNQFFQFIVVGVFLPLPVIFMILAGAISLRRRNA